MSKQAAKRCVSPALKKRAAAALAADEVEIKAVRLEIPIELTGKPHGQAIFTSLVDAMALTIDSADFFALWKRRKRRLTEFWHIAYLPLIWKRRPCIA